MVKRREFMHIDVIGIRSPINRRGDPGLPLKVEFAQIKLIRVVPFSIDEPTKASSYLSVTTDSNWVCTVTAISSPSPPRICHSIG
jgi:hypothetical protein